MNKKLIVSIILALLLSITPLPDAIIAYRPLILTLVCIYWAIYHSSDFGLGKAFVIGLFLDVLHGTLLGQTSLCLVAITAACMYYQRSFRMSPIFQQILFVLMFCALYQFLFIWTDSINERPLATQARMLTALISALLWPAIVVIMNNTFFRVPKTDKDK